MLKLCLIFSITLIAFAPAEAAPHPTARELPAQARPVDQVIVPVPREIFDTLDKFADSNWGVVQRRELTKWKARGDQPQLALMLGTLIAEGFVAVEAKDAAQVKHIGDAILEVAAALAVKQSVLRHSRAIVDDAERNDWKAVRREWDGVFADLEGAMDKLDSKPLSQLVSLGGWLRGTEVLSAVILQNYSVEGAELLRQPDTLDYFDKRITGMKPKMRSEPLVAALQQGLRKIRPLIQRDEGEPVSREAVVEINAITRELVEQVHLKASAQVAPPAAGSLVAGMDRK